MDVRRVAGGYGEFTVLVDGETVMSGGPLGWLGVLPSKEEVVAAVRSRLASTGIGEERSKGTK